MKLKYNCIAIIYYYNVMLFFFYQSYERFKICLKIKMQNNKKKVVRTKKHLLSICQMLGATYSLNQKSHTLDITKLNTLRRFAMIKYQDIIMWIICNGMEFIVIGYQYVFSHIQSKDSLSMTMTSNYFLYMQQVKKKNHF